MFRLLRGGVLSAVVIAGSLAVVGSSIGSAAGSTPQQGRVQRWQLAIEKLPVPGKGCFTASYPRVEWLRTGCKEAPPNPYPPVHGIGPETVGNGLDYSAEVSGVLTSASGSFDSVSPGTTETGQQNGVGPQVPNTFSLQLNAKPFTSPKCSGSPNPGCLGWQQFIYSTTFNEVFMQYWLLKYNTSCPGGWNTFMFPMSTDIYCWRNSSSSSLPGGPLTVGGLTGTTLTGKAVGGGNDSVVMTTISGTATATGADSVLHIASDWKGVEFAIVGDCCGTQANFSPGTTINVRTTTHSGTHSAPFCVLEGFTGETNNLNLASTPAIGTQAHPTLISRQTSSPGSPSCATAAGIGDTHLTTFRDLLYDFQASGDFELATTGPGFSVQARQVSGAPTWPNAAVNEAIATHVGKADVAICLARSASGGPTGRLVINRKTVKLASGGRRKLPGGGQVSLTGNVYLISGSGGNSVQAQINAGNPDWINVSVGLGRWPETIHGLLANYRENPKAIQSRGGTVLTTPFPFKEFYNLYGNSWRVSPRQSLLTVCGGKVASGNPRNLMYSGNLNPKLAEAARAACIQIGVQDPPLLDACTVDVAVLGTRDAALTYLAAPRGLIWGKILKP